MARVSATALTAALKGAKFPAAKDHLMHVAQRKGSSKEVVEAIRNLPDKFYTMTEVERAFSEQVRK